MEGKHTPQHVNQEDADPVRRGLIIAGALGVVGALGVYGWRDGWFNGSTEPQANPVEPPPTEVTPDVSIPLPELDKSHEVDLLAGGTWKFMPGARQEGSALRVQETGLTIRKHPDEWADPNIPEHIPNPPLNSYGTYLETGGQDFGITMLIGDLKADEPAVINLHSEPDFIYDERRYVHAKTQVAVHEDRVVVRVWHGNGPDADETQEIIFGQAVREAGIWVRQHGSQVIVGAGEKQVVFGSDMFAASGQVWFGMDGNFSLTSLKAYPKENAAEFGAADASKVQLGKQTGNGLQVLAAKRRSDLLIGAAVHPTPITRFGKVAETIGNHFGGLKPETSGKMQAIYVGEPEADGSAKPEHFIWDELDAFVDLARRAGRKYNLHTLIFGEAMPKAVEQMLQDIANGKRPLEHAEQFLNTYIPLVVKRYPDAEAIDVVNEPLADTSIFDVDGGVVMNENAWFNAFNTRNEGARYIEVACTAARKAGARKILLNDNGAETDDARADALLAIAEPLRRKGVLDGIGLQAHLDAGDLEHWIRRDRSASENEKAVYQHMSARFAWFARSGLEVQISELSMDEEDPHIQAQVAAGFMRAAIRSRNVSAVWLWSPINGPWGFTAEPGEGYNISNGNDGPWGWNDDREVTVEKETLGGFRHGLTA